tara:strand:+ start:21150 stop:21374 length:225 start_codon:yes stop_codon:yes gene_type:complete
MSEPTEEMIAEGEAFMARTGNYQTTSEYLRDLYLAMQAVAPSEVPKTTVQINQSQRPGLCRQCGCPINAHPGAI